MRIETNEKLVLTAEMLLPGLATLTLAVDPGESALKRRVVLTAHFRPRGLFGITYWHSVVPLHGIVFRGMLNGIVREAERLDKLDRSKLPA